MTKITHTWWWKAYFRRILIIQVVYDDSHKVEIFQVSKSTVSLLAT